MNDQAPKPQRRDFDGLYHVHSHFFTIQGEGPFSGDPAYFFRLRDCNLQCPACDTDYTGGERAFDGTAKVLVAIAQLGIKDGACDLVVITGGEPFRQDLTDMVKVLREAGFRVQIETNGTMAPSDAFKEYAEKNMGVAIVVSPKASYVDPWIERHAIAYKYVLTHGFIDPADGLPTEVLGRKSTGIARPLKGIPHIFVQPADPAMLPFGFEELGEIAAANLKATIASCQKFGHRMQLQIHKHMGVE